MNELYTLLLNAGITLLVFITLLLAGIIKKQMGYIYLSLLALLAGIIWVSWGVYSVGKKTLRSAFQPRSGTAIYEALLGKPDTNCVSVLHSRDQLIPKIDTEIILHFKTCPGELQRILNNKAFKESVRIPAAAVKDHLSSALPDWFRPAEMSDTLLVFSSIDDYGNGQEIYSSPDSTEVYLRDIWD